MEALGGGLSWGASLVALVGPGASALDREAVTTLWEFDAIFFWGFKTFPQKKWEGSMTGEEEKERTRKVTQRQKKAQKLMRRKKIRGLSIKEVGCLSRQTSRPKLVRIIGGLPKSPARSKTAEEMVKNLIVRELCKSGRKGQRGSARNPKNRPGRMCRSARVVVLVFRAFSCPEGPDQPRSGANRARARGGVTGTSSGQGCHRL